ncbi:hypothetical protein [Gilvimarinus algae]|uniref:IPT/TIG domain-containing protein n=1 Tax=Gilvimarinus algae TaxID=3058037 RepID=A0ABT8TC12_9GAMM|nr:hypothetical protein [Gilvimarinus sp. SDUM040014]MDO3381129.1 hypothetical protein [Gilvimarinus sp. SDUM040014]
MTPALAKRQGSIHGILFVFMVACVVATISACQTQKKEPVVVSAIVPTNSDKPSILQLVDLGGLDIQNGGGVPVHFHDSEFSPGEWVLVRGKNLGVSSVSVDGLRVPVKQYFGNYPLFKIPVGLSPVNEHTLVIENEYGESRSTFTTKHYLFANDLDDSKTHILQVDRNSEGFIREEWLELESPADRPLFTIVSNDSRFLYQMDVGKRSGESLMDEADTYPVIVRTFHLAAPQRPEKVAESELAVGSVPIDSHLSGDNTLLLLGKQSFTLVDAADPLSLSTLSHTALPFNEDGSTTYVDAIFLDNDKKLALLETYSNRVVLFDVSDRASPKLIDEVQLLPSKTVALSIDLEPVPDNPTAFWVLEGPNYRVAGSKLADMYKRIVLDRDISESRSLLSQLQRVAIADNKLVLDRRVSLPEGFASYFSVFGEDGRLYITQTKTDFFNVDMEEGSPKTILKRVGDLVWENMSLGRVVAFDLETEAVETISRGVGIYYHIVDVPGIGQVFTLLKFGPSFSFPYLTPNWGVGVKTTGTYAKRKMNRRAAFPPYSIGFIAYQY